MTQTQEIKNALTGGKNCAQIVAETIANRLNIDSKPMLAATIGFGGGVSRQAMMCGACTGAVVALGFANDQSGKPAAEVRNLTYKQVKEMFAKFNEIYGSTTCKDLLQCDISTPEGFEIHRTGAHVDKCVGFIETAIDILDDMLKAE